MKILFYSSFLFIFNIILCLLYKKYAYGYYFILLFYTSIIYHYYSNVYTYYIDQLSVLLIILYGTKCFVDNLTKCFVDNLYNSLIMLCFILTVFIYIYNSFNNCDIYHVYIHIITTIGHSLIIMS